MENEKSRIENKFFRILKGYNKEKCDTIKSYFDLLYRKEGKVNGESKD